MSASLSLAAMEKYAGERRILVVSFPGQGHINPTLQFAKRLLQLDVKVTFLTAFLALNRMSIPSSPPFSGLTFVGFSTGYDDGIKQDDDFGKFMSNLHFHGSNKVTELLSAAADEGRPFSRVVYATLLPWAAESARASHVPPTLLWIQPAAVFDVYYYYFNGFREEIEGCTRNSSLSVHMPGLPNLGKDDFPSFFFPKNNAYDYVVPLFKEHLKVLESDDPPNILINTFESLEPEALKALTPRFNLIPIGPIISPPDKMVTVKNSSEYMEFLDSNPKGSVIYVSFGSYSSLSVKQNKEIAKGLIISGRPFLWVVRDNPEAEEMGKQGKIVSWCSQLEVLSHPSVGCFISHCGWNSTLESLVCGVPMVGFPQWTDQMTNAKLVEDVWRIGVRVERGSEDGMVKGEEFNRCIDMVMMGSGEEMRKNARKWKVMSGEAGKEGGQSDVNLINFVNQL